jgi:hypothetical protein
MMNHSHSVKKKGSINSPPWKAIKKRAYFSWQSQSKNIPVPHCKGNPIDVFPEKELRGLSPNFHIHVSVSDLYIPRIGPHIVLQQKRQTQIVEIYKSLTDT